MAGEIMGCPGTRECAVEAGGYVSRGGVCTQYVSMWESRLNKSYIYHNPNFCFFFFFFYNKSLEKYTEMLEVIPISVFKKY